MKRIVKFKGTVKKRTVKFKGIVKIKELLNLKELLK